MVTLALDTATDYLVITLSREGEVLAEVFSHSPRAHQEKLFPALDDLLKKNELSIGEIELLVVGVGPGSYTGMRVGVSAVKGISFALGLPVVGVCTLRAIAHTLFREGKVIIPVLDAKRGEVYYAAYKGSGAEEVLSPRAGKKEEFLQFLRSIEDEYLLVGEADRFFSEFCSQGRIVSDFSSWGKSLVKLGEEIFKEKGRTPLSHLKPLYLRPSYAEEKFT